MGKMAQEPAAIAIAALQLVYAQLVVVYQTLRQQPTANTDSDLDASITAAVAAVTGLKTALNSLIVVGDAALTLAGMQSVAAAALVTLQNAQAAPNDE